MEKIEKSIENEICEHFLQIYSDMRTQKGMVDKDAKILALIHIYSEHIHACTCAEYSNVSKALMESSGMVGAAASWAKNYNK